MLLPGHRDPYLAHISAVDTLVAAGIAAPPEWTALRGRWDDFVTTDSPVAQRLTSAILNGTEAELPVLRALALAEEAAGPTHVAAINNRARVSVTRRLRELYSPVAQQNYQAIAARFDRQAAEFTTAASVIDPEAPADTVVTADAKIRKAWTDSLLAAQQLTQLIPVLQAAAELAGHPAATAESVLPLVCDPGQAHRRRVWEAWESNGRCGRWSALNAVGVSIRAAQLADLAPYRKPRPMEEQWVQVDRGQHRRIIVDPEDSPQPVDA